MRYMESNSWGSRGINKRFLRFSERPLTWFVPPTLCGPAQDIGSPPLKIEQTPYLSGSHGGMVTAEKATAEFLWRCTKT
jgi:hypothetical protein